MYWCVYLENREYVLESLMNIFLDNCSVSEEFWFVVKWMCLKILDDVVIVVM